VRVSPERVVIVVGGVDPALGTTGVAVISFDEWGARWETGRVQWPAAARTPKTVGDELVRLRFQVAGVVELLGPRLDLVVIEGASMGSEFRGKSDERGGLRWMLVDRLADGTAVTVVSPRTRAQLATGFGGSRKEDVLPAVRGAFAGVEVADHNVADAVVLAAAGAARLGFPVPYSADQAKAHARIAWPVMERSRSE